MKTRLAKRGKAPSPRFRLDIPWSDRERIEREYSFFGSVIPAATDDPGRKRTAYFYRKMALAFARDAREFRRSISYYVTDGPGFLDTLNSLAKTYLREYRQRKAAAA